MHFKRKDSPYFVFLKCRDSPYVVHFKSRDYPYVESLPKKIRSNQNLTQVFSSKSTLCPKRSWVQKNVKVSKILDPKKFGIPKDAGSLNILSPFIVIIIANRFWEANGSLIQKNVSPNKLLS